MGGSEFWEKLSKQHLSRSFCYSNAGRVLMCELIFAIDGKEGLFHFNKKLQDEAKSSDSYDEKDHVAHIGKIFDGMRQSLGLVNKPYAVQTGDKFDFLSRAD